MLGLSTLGIVHTLISLVAVAAAIMAFLRNKRIDPDGVRTFVSDGGWVDGKMAFVTAPPARQERFTFERQGPAQFKMTYEVSSDGKSWRLGDYLGVATANAKRIIRVPARLHLQANGEINAIVDLYRSGQPA